MEFTRFLEPGMKDGVRTIMMLTKDQDWCGTTMSSKENAMNCFSLLVAKAGETEWTRQGLAYK